MTLTQGNSLLGAFGPSYQASELLIDQSATATRTKPLPGT